MNKHAFLGIILRPIFGKRGSSTFVKWWSSTPVLEQINYVRFETWVKFQKLLEE